MTGNFPLRMIEGCQAVLILLANNMTMLANPPQKNNEKSVLFRRWCIRERKICVCLMTQALQCETALILIGVAVVQEVGGCPVVGRTLVSSLTCMSKLLNPKLIAMAILI